MAKSDVQDLVELPKAIGCKWIFKWKIGSDGSFEQYKARLVAQDFSQQYDPGYDETFCPVICIESLCTLVAKWLQPASDGLHSSIF